jgi:hypothetical protein
MWAALEDEIVRAFGKIGGKRNSLGLRWGN